MLNSVKHIVLQKNRAVARTPLSRLAVRGLCALFGTILYASVTIAQTVTGGTLYINGSFINAGTIAVNNHVVNNTSGSVSVLPGSTASNVRLTGAANANGHSIYGGGPISFYRLDVRGARETRLKVNVEVTNQLRIGYTGNTFTAADSGFTVENNTLTIDSAATYAGTANLIFAGGTVAYTGTASQATINKANGIRYGTLNFSGAGAKTISATTSGLDTAATLSQTGGQLSITESIDITGSATLADLGAISATKKLKFTTSATSGTVTSMSNSSTGTLENASNGTVTIATLVGNTGTINQSGATGTVAFTNAATSTGTITNSSTGTVTFNNTIANNNPGIISNTSTGTITFTNNVSGTGSASQTTNGTMNVGGSFTQNTYTLTGGTVVYNSTTAAQSVIGTSYNNLTISTTGGGGIATASGTLTLTGNLVVNSSRTLEMAGYSSSAFPGGSNDNAGTIRWSGDNVYVSGAGLTEFYGAGIGTVAAGANYGNLLFSGTGMKTLSSACTATGDMTVNSGALVTVGAVAVQINGDLNLNNTITNNGTVTVGN